MEPKQRREVAYNKLLKAEIAVNENNLYKPRDGDIIIVGPPKCGSTWMQQILHQIRSKGDESFDDIYSVVWYIRNPKGYTGFNLNGEQVCNPRVYKQHDAYGIIETTEKQKRIVILRDPYDACYSWLKFIDGYFGSDEEISEDELVDLLHKFHSGNVNANFKCMSTWWQHRTDPHVKIVFYEDLKRDLRFMIRNIADFAEISLSDSELDRVTELCSFEYMAKHKEKFQGELVAEGIAKGIGSDKWIPKVGMVRESGGQVGQGLKHMGPKLKATVEHLWNESMKNNFGYENYQEMYLENTLLK